MFRAGATQPDARCPKKESVGTPRAQQRRVGTAAPGPVPGETKAQSGAGLGTRGGCFGAVPLWVSSETAEEETRRLRRGRLVGSALLANYPRSSSPVPIILPATLMGRGPRCVPILGTHLRGNFPLGGEFSSRAGMEGAAGVSPVPLTCEECRESRGRHPRSGTLRERQLQAFREDRTG